MGKPNVIASVFRNGIVRIDMKCREGALPLCSGPIDAVVDTVTSHCVLCYESVGYKFPKLQTIEDDSDALNFIDDISKQMRVDIATAVQ